MSKRVAVTLPDDIHAQVTERAAEAGISAHAWLVAAIEREAYRQLLAKAAAWGREHPEHAAAAQDDYRKRQAARRGDATRGSSAA